MLRRLLHAGTSFARSAADAQRIQIVNAITLAAIAITVVLQPFNLALGDLPATYNGAAATALFVLTYWLSASGRAWSAALILSLVTPLAIGAQIYVDDAVKGGSQLFLLAAALIPCLTFPSAATRSAAAVSLLSALVLIGDVVTRHGQAEVLAAISEPGVRTELVHTAIAVVVCLLGFLTWRLLQAGEHDVEREQRRSEAILLDLFPRAIARRLQRHKRIRPQRHGDASVLFCRVVQLEADSPDIRLRALSALFAAFDDVCARRGVEKLKNFGSSYMAASGVPQGRDDHAEALAAAAIDMLIAAARFPARVVVRIGVHSGPVVAGVIGRNRYTYDIWGDVVNTAQRMEAHGVEGVIQVSSLTFSKINHRFRCAPRDPIQIKGKLTERTYLLRADAADAERSS